MKRILLRGAIFALIILSTVAPAFAAAPESRDEQGGLFGYAASRSNDLSAFTKWRGVVRAQAKAPDNTETAEWKAFLAGLRGKSKAEQLDAVNDYMNRLPYITDQKNYGVADHWATVSEFLARGGDCEDYAIAKYFSLAALGFDTNAMRLVILFDKNKGINHAVLAVSVNGEEMILDNQASSVRDAQDISSYKPIYALSGRNWWRFI